MKDNYDFTDSVKNPYVSKLKKQITIRVDAETIDYFKNQANKTGITYQNLINLYLRDCVENKRQPVFGWKQEFHQKRCQCTEIPGEDLKIF